MIRLLILCYLINIVLFASEVEVSVVKPISDTLNIEFQANGIIIPKNKTVLTAQASGILKLCIENNTYVYKGQKIAYIIDERRIQKLKQLKNKVKILKNELDLEYSNLIDVQNMYNMGVGSRVSYLNKKVVLAQLEDLYQSTKSEYKLLLLEEKNSVLYSKEDGFITNLMSDNRYIVYGNVLANFSLKSVVVKLFVYAKYISSLKKGMQVKLISSYKNTYGTITDILPQSSNDLVEVIVKPKHTLPANLNISANITINKAKGLSIPKDSIVLIDNNPAVYIIKNNIAHLSFIKIIKDMVETVLIKNTLPQNSVIALKNAYMLHNNLKVILK